MTKSFIISRIIVYTKMILWFTIGVILLGVIFNIFVMPAYVGQLPQTTVPDLIELDKEEAISMLKARKLEPVISIAPYDPIARPNTVIAQNPFSGASVKEGRRVYLSVTAEQPNNVEMPVLVGKSERDAVITLRQLKLQKGGIIYQQSDEYPERVVIQQSVKPEEVIPEGTLVTLVVSRGASKERVQVPDLLNLSLNDGQKAILRSGLSTGIIRYIETDELLPNTITNQNPRANEIVPYGKPVDLWVTKKVERVSN